MAKVELLPGSFISVVNGDGTGAGEITIDETQVLARGPIADVYRTLSDYLTISASETEITGMAVGSSSHTINGESKYIEPAWIFNRLGVNDYKLHLIKPGAGATIDSGNIDSALGDVAQTYFNGVAQRMEGQILDTAKNYVNGAVNGFFVNITSGPGSAQGLKKIVASFGQRITVIDGWSDPQPGEGTPSDYEIVDINTKRVHDFAHMGAGSGIDIDLIRAHDYSDGQSVFRSDRRTESLHPAIFPIAMEWQTQSFHRDNGLMRLPGSGFVIQYGFIRSPSSNLAQEFTSHNLYFANPWNSSANIHVIPFGSCPKIGTTTPYIIVDDLIKTDSVMIDGVTLGKKFPGGSFEDMELGYLAIGEESGLYPMTLLYAFDSASNWQVTGPSPVASDLALPYLTDGNLHYASSEGSTSLAFPTETDDWNASSGTTGWTNTGGVDFDIDYVQNWIASPGIDLNETGSDRITFQHGVSFTKNEAGTATAHYDFPSPIDCTGSMIYLRFAMRPPLGSGFMTFLLSFEDTSGRKAQYIAQPTATDFTCQGGIALGLDADSPGINWSITGGWDKTQISRVQIDSTEGTYLGDLKKLVINKVARIPKSATFYNDDLGSDHDWRFPSALTDPMRLKWLVRHFGIAWSVNSIEALLHKVTFMFSDTTGQALPANRFEVEFINEEDIAGVARPNSEFGQMFTFTAKRFSPTTVGSPDASKIRYIGIKFETGTNADDLILGNGGYGHWPYLHPHNDLYPADTPHSKPWTYGNDFILGDLSVLGELGATSQAESFDDVSSWVSGHSNPLLGTGPANDASTKYEGVASAKMTNFVIDNPCNDHITGWTHFDGIWWQVSQGFPPNDPSTTYLDPWFALPVWSYYTFPTPFDATNCLLAVDIFGYSITASTYYWESGTDTGGGGPPGPNGVSFTWDPSDPDKENIKWYTIVIDADSPSNSFGSFDKTDIRRFSCYNWGQYITNIRRINKYVEHYDGSRTPADYTSSASQPFSLQHYGYSNDLTDEFGMWLSSSTSQARPADRFEWVKSGAYSIGAWSKNNFNMTTYGFPSITNIQSMGIFTQVQSGDRTVKWTRNQTGMINIDDLRFDSGS
jgi:hypothetical protein